MKPLRLLLPSVTQGAHSWVPSLTPVFVALLIFTVAGIWACIPRAALDRAMGKRPALLLDATPVGRHVIWGAYPGQVQNYRQHTAQLCDGDVILDPSSGLPSSVTIIVPSQNQAAREKKRAKFAWLHCVEMRRNYLDPLEANQCEVRMIDTQGRLIAFVSGATVRNDLHCKNAPETLLSHSQEAMADFLRK